MKLGKQFALVALALAAAAPAFAQYRSGGINASLQLLSIPEVRKELKLSDSQVSQVVAVQNGIKTGMLAMARSIKDVPPAERRKKFDSFRSDLDRKVVLILDPAQRKRLHELDLQRSGPRVLLKPDVGAELHVTPAQQAKLTTAIREESMAIRTMYRDATKALSPAEQEEARNKIKLLQAKTDSAIYDVLTDDQKSKFRVMQGPPFKFPERKAVGVTVTTPGQTAKPATPPKSAPAPKPAPKPIGKK